MSFLSSHRLHWGVHHELSDNFWVQLKQMSQSTSDASTPQTKRSATDPTELHKPPQPALPDNINPTPSILED